MVLIEDILKNARNRHIPVMLDEGMKFLLKYIKENNICNILEIGSAVGYSAIRFALLKDNIKVTSIEINEELHHEALANVTSFGLGDRINLILGDALKIEVDGNYDLIFIDAAKSQYINFFEKYKNYLTPNGVIVTDNLSFHGLVENPTLTHNRNTRQLVRKIAKYIDFLKENKEFETTFYHKGDGISISRRIAK